jgi:hypothetical protein
VQNFRLTHVECFTCEIYGNLSVNLKLSNYRPGQVPRIPEFEGPRISGQSACESDKVASPTHRPSLLPRKYPWYSFLLEAESTPGI